MNFINKWKDKIAQSIGDKVESVKLDFIDKTSGILGYLLFTFIAIFLLLAVLIFLGIGLGEVFSELLDSRSGGYFATAGVYVLLVGLLFVFRTNVVDGFAGIFIKMLTHQNDDDDDDEDKDDKK
jgi:hypothetical protein